MPNILCLHLKRDDIPKEQNIKVALALDNFDVAPFVKASSTYVQDETKYELIGYIENIGTDERPKYVPTLKNMKSGQWFTIRDHEFMKRDDKSILENYASMVFYRKKFDFSRQKETRNLKSQIELMGNEDLKVDPSRIVYIPNYWFEKAISLASPGMIHTWHLLCKHGNIKPSYRDCFFTKNKNPNVTNTSMLEASFIDKTFIASPEDMDDSKGSYTSLFIENQSVKLPKEIGEYFLEKYGGGPLIKGVNACQECLEEAIAVKSRRRKERKIISMYDSKKTQISYAVSSEWIEQWKSFLYVNNRFLRRNFLKGHPAPGPINNSKLFDEDGKINFSLERNKHFRVVNAYVWRIFMELYGGGPEVKLSGKDLSTYLSPEHKVEIQMSSSDIEILGELRGLLKKDKNEKILAEL